MTCRDPFRLALGFALLLVGCKTTATTPQSHRAADVACQQGSPLAASTPSGTCTTAADCPAVANVRCVPYEDAGPDASVSYCNDDACDIDDECGDGGVCLCGAAASSSTLPTANVCLTAGNCRLDSDCPPAHPYCSSSSIGCGTSFAYYCHTGSDDCGNDSDCRSDQFCQYDPGANKWTCVDASGCN